MSKRSIVPLMASAMTSPARCVTLTPWPEYALAKKTFGAMRPNWGTRLIGTAIVPPQPAGALTHAGGQRPILPSRSNMGR